MTDFGDLPVPPVTLAQLEVALVRWDLRITIHAHWHRPSDPGHDLGPVGIIVWLWRDGGDIWIGRADSLEHAIQAAIGEFLADDSTQT